MAVVNQRIDASTGAVEVDRFFEGGLLFLEVQDTSAGSASSSRAVVILSDDEAREVAATLLKAVAPNVVLGEN